MASSAAVKTAAAVSAKSSSTAATTSTTRSSSTTMLVSVFSGRSPPLQQRAFSSSLASTASPSAPPQRQSQQLQTRSFHSFQQTQKNPIFAARSFKLKQQSTTATATDFVTVRCFSSKGKRDFYELLGVDRSADKSTVKKAYFKMAKQYHPDANQVRLFILVG
jgi:hypothetical protein